MLRRCYATIIIYYADVYFKIRVIATLLQPAFLVRRFDAAFDVFAVTMLPYAIFFVFAVMLRRRRYAIRHDATLCATIPMAPCLMLRYC